jgi:hypothetical protein
MPAELREGFAFADGEKLAAWCRAKGVNVGTVQSPPDVELPGERPAATTLALLGLDMNVVTVSPNSYEEMSLAELKELVARWPPRPEMVYYWPPHHDQTWIDLRFEPRRDTYIIATKSGTLGLLQIKGVRGSLAFRYRLAKNPSRKN